jgi:hypothetical protein
MYWVAIRDNAQRLFESFESRWTKSCSCQSYHCASIQLDRTEKDRFDTLAEMRFKLVLNFDNSCSTVNAGPWDWRDVEIASEQVAKYVYYSNSLLYPMSIFKQSLGRYLTRDQAICSSERCKHPKRPICGPGIQQSCFNPAKRSCIIYIYQNDQQENSSRCQDR